MSSVDFNGKPFHFREDNFGDKYTISENLRGRQYGPLKLTKDDVVLDIGGHIGTFAVPTSLLVKQVISVEMDEENYSLLAQNTSNYDNIFIVNACCVSQRSSEGQLLEFRAAKNSGAHSLFVKRGRGTPVVVKSISILHLLEKYQPTIIKCDTEGAEFDIFAGLEIPACVRQMIIEFHLNSRGNKEAVMELLKEFKKQGFTFEPFDYLSSKRWTKVQYFTREL